MTNDLSQKCRDVAQAAVEAEAWIDDPANAELVGAEAGPARREVRRLAMRARKLGRAAARPMCVSVFGPSQAGKSFLVSVLARPQGGELISNFPGPNGQLDFIREINPEGEGESTGIVTRFSIRGYQAPDGFPVKLNLLSEADVGRILTNTFMMDGDNSEPEPTPEEIDALLAQMRPRAGQGAPGLTPEDVIETQEYLTKMFGKRAYTTQLAGYWEPVIDLAPRLSIRDRAELFAVLWGRHDAFTRLYVRLAEALAALDHPEEAFVPLAALHPRETSIIDVKLLNGLDAEGGERLTVVSSAGQRADLPRPVITALTAELILPMRETPHPLFEGTDLLDFPGARTRFEKPLEEYLQDASEPLKECVLRGKVAYLFDRYVAEQEITSMLLCIPDSNMEVADLPVLVADWIAHTHGTTAEARAAANQLLFFVLTKFDKHLIDSAGSSDDAATRFERRMHASLIEKFAPMPTSWPLTWSPGGPFDNCFWLRNPNFPAEAVIEYEGTRELRLIERKRARLDELRAGCLAAPLVQRHFKDETAAWEAAMSLNDGGVTYLIEHLTPVCRPEMKASQVEAQLTETVTRLSDRLSRFFVSDDLAERLEERMAAAAALNQELLRVYQHGRLGALLDELLVSAERIAARMQRPPSNVRFVGGRTKARPSQPDVVLPGQGAAAASAAATPQIVLPGGTAVPATPTAASSGAARQDEVRSMTRAEWRAEIAFDEWVDGLKTLAGAEDIQHRFSISHSAAHELTGELIQAARRLGLEARIADELEARSYQDRNESDTQSSAAVAAEHLNAFTTDAGASFLALETRPDVQMPDGSSRKPFAPRRQTDGVEGIPAAPRAALVDYLTDWLHILHRVFEDNAKDVAGSQVDPEQNLRLGGILKTLRAV
ncbi:MAG: virulence factor SrfC family protein [Pseudomonadota bacterium]